MEKFFIAVANVVPWLLRITLIIFIWSGLIIAVLWAMNTIDTINRADAQKIKSAQEEAQKTKEKWFAGCEEDNPKYKCQIMYKQAGWQ